MAGFAGTGNFAAPESNEETWAYRRRKTRQGSLVLGDRSTGAHYPELHQKESGTAMNAINSRYSLAMVMAAAILSCAIQAGAEELTLDQCIQTGLTNSPDIRAA